MPETVDDIATKIADAVRKHVGAGRFLYVTGEDSRDDRRRTVMADVEAFAEQMAPIFLLVHGALLQRAEAAERVAPKWISVPEQLPPVNTDVLAMWEADNYAVAGFVQQANGEIRGWYSGGHRVIDPTCWTPIVGPAAKQGTSEPRALWRKCSCGGDMFEWRHPFDPMQSDHVMRCVKCGATAPISSVPADGGNGK
jgi:hypothetical protein